MKRGDVVLAKFPHATGSSPKNRPVLIVQADFYNQRISNVLVAAITSNLARQADAAHLLIEASTLDGRRSGLTRDSLISCLNLAVIPKADLGLKIGELSADVMKHIDACLRTALGIQWPSEKQERSPLNVRGESPRHAIRLARVQKKSRRQFTTPSTCSSQ